MFIPPPSREEKGVVNQCMHIHVVENGEVGGGGGHTHSENKAKTGLLYHASNHAHVQRHRNVLSTPLSINSLTINCSATGPMQVML